MARRGPKSWTSKRTKPSYARPARSTAYRKRVGAAAALSGMKPGVPKASSVHRFTRWGPQLTLVSYDAGGGIKAFQILNEDGATTTPISISSPFTDSTGDEMRALGGSAQWRLSDLPGVTDFTNLFDHYTIEQVDVEVNDTHNHSSSDSNQQSMPTITYTPDFDDTTVPTAASTIAEYQRAKTHTFRGDGKPLKFSIKPRVAQPVYRQSVTSAYMAGPENTRINTTYNDVSHFGLKFWMNQLAAYNTPDTGATRITFKMKYHLKFADPK